MEDVRSCCSSWWSGVWNVSYEMSFVNMYYKVNVFVCVCVAIGCLIMCWGKGNEQQIKNIIYYQKY